MKNWKAAFCYTGVLSIFFFKSKDDFLKFHARQGFALFTAAMLALLIPLIGGLIICPIIFITAFTAAMKALDYKKWKVPVINRLIKY
ncbi:MAG: hypothetical protein JW791_04950 [Nanoarchaeota archaeon]|nr:hypothetical protein [Nanoarchaeota archaeon]